MDYNSIRRKTKKIKVGDMYIGGDAHVSIQSMTNTDTHDKEKTYADGEFHMLENMETAGTLYTKNHIDPMLSLAEFADGYYDPKEDSVQPEAKAASKLFGENSKLAVIVPTTDEMGMYNGDLTTLKNELIAKVIMGEMTYEDAMAKYESDGGKTWSDAIVASLNK